VQPLDVMRIEPSRPGLFSVLVLCGVSASPGSDSARADVGIPRAPTCVSSLVHTFPSGHRPLDVSMRAGVVLFRQWQPNPVQPASSVSVLDVATNTVVALTAPSTIHDDYFPEFVNDEFIVYERHRWTVFIGEMRAHWRGWDGAWGTADDVDWAFDSAPFGTFWPFEPAHGNEGEIAYLSTPYIGGAEIRHCDFSLGSAHPCVPGFVAVEPLASPSYPAHALQGGVTLVTDVNWQGFWVDPRQPPQPWISEVILDTFGPFVASAQFLAPGINVRIATNPATPPIWVVPASNFSVPSFSSRVGSTGGVRLGWIESSGRGFVADILGNPVQVAEVTSPTTWWWLSPDGDDVAYLTVPDATGNERIAVDTCLF
jgi:hypothetical protein